ncbi:MAG: phospholipase [bacterium]|nr:phospholipase [bacterium]
MPQESPIEFPAALPPELRELWSQLSEILTAFGDAQDRLDPPKIPEYADRLAPLAAALEKTVHAIDVTKLDRDAPAAVLTQSGVQLLGAASRFQGARTGPHEILKAFQALRPIARANDILFPLANRFVEISEHYLTPARRSDVSLRESLAKAAANPERGLMHFNNQRGHRGGYSLYVPENYTPDRAWPLIVALHGGSGHGADFLWSWLRDARAHGCLLAVPTSRDRTWSLHSPGVDAAGLNRMLDSVSGKWNVDAQRLLLTGISDGGTYSMLLSIVKQSPFTHYAPVAAAVHVLQNREGRVEAPVRDTRIYQVHGAVDWMFPVEKARAAAQALKDAGAAIDYREIADLSHNYPRDENPAILRWFSPELFESN